MNIFSLFSGIGAFEKALSRMKIPYDLIGFSEIDKYAVKSYCAIHNVDESKNLGDITKIDETTLPKNIDLITYGFPCQDISLAGKQKGLFNEDGTQTRSGLFFEAFRIIEETKPRVAIAENVKNLTSKKFAEQFKIVLESLEQAGYTNYYKVLNAKDYGIPQNRERVFIVSIRKDIDNGTFTFPEGFPLELRLKDMLESEVDEKFYLKDTANFFIKNSFDMERKGNGFRFEPHVQKNANVAKTITTRAGARMDDNFVADIESDSATFKFDSTNKEITLKQIGQIYGTEREPNPQAGRIYDADGISPTLDSCSGGNRMPKVATEPSIQRVDIPQTVKVRKYPVDCELLCECLRNHKNDSGLTNKDIAEALNVPITKVEHWFRQDDCFAIPDAEIWFQLKTLLDIGTDVFDLSIMTFEEKEGVYEKSERHYSADGIIPTLTSATAAEKIIEPSLKIRKLTPKECFRLMGFDDSDFEKAEAVNSNTQLYKQAGNSIVVPVVEHIIKALFDCGALENEREKKTMELKINAVTLPETISFNYEELKNELIEKTAKYETMVYSDDQIKLAKEDRANLNKLKKALNDERIRQEKEYMQPFNVFKAQINEIISIIDKPILMIDGQVKEFEEAQKKEKLEQCKLIFEATAHPEWLQFEQIFNQKWLNASVTQKAITEEIDTAIETINNNISALQILPEFSFEAIEVYKTTLDINKALEEGKRLAEIQKKKAEAEAQALSQVPEEEQLKQINEQARNTIAEREWIGFQALLSTDEAKELGQYLRSKNIQYKAI